MEIALASFVGLAVAGVVFALGQSFIASRDKSDQVQQLPEPTIFDSAALDSASEVVGNSDKTEMVGNETETATDLAAAVSEEQIVKVPKKARKSRAAGLQDPAKAPSRPRRRKTTETIVPGSDVVQ
jgi:hypothetical protein